MRRGFYGAVRAAPFDFRLGAAHDVAHPRRIVKRARTEPDPEPLSAPPAPSTPRVGFLGDPRRERLVVAAVVLLAFLVRVVYVLQMRSSPLFAQPVMDSLYHVELARAFAEGGDRHPGPFFRAPLYPWFLGLLFKCCGDGLLLPRLVQCVFGSLSTLLVYAIGKRAFDARVGFVAALMAATYWVLVYFDGELLIPTLVVPLYLLGLWLTLGVGELAAAGEDARAGRTRKLCSAAGLAWGVAALARPNALLFMPAVALWIAYLFRAQGRRALLPALLFSAGLLAPILPVTAYNTFVEGDAVLISTQGGVNFWIGNNPGSDGSSAIVPNTRAGWWEGYADAIAQAQAAEGRELRPSEVSRHYAGRAWDFIFSQPGAAADLGLRKLRLFWSDWELGNNQVIRFFAYRFGPIVRFLPLGFGVLAAAGLCGLFLSLRGRGAQLFPLWGFVLVYSASVVAFFINARFRVPILPVLMVYAAWCGVWIFECLRTRRLGPALAVLAAITGFSLWSRDLPQGVRTDDSNGLAQLAVAESIRGNHDLAVRYFEQAVRVHPFNFQARTNLAKLLQRQGRPAEALVHAKQAVDSGLRNVDAIDLTLDLLIETGDLAQAEAFAQQVVQRVEGLAVPRYHLARIAWSRQDWGIARARFQETLVRDPGHFDAARGLGMAYRNMGRPEEAAEAFQHSLTLLARARPEFADEAWRQWIDVLTELKRGAQAEAARRAYQDWKRQPAATRG